MAKSESTKKLTSLRTNIAKNRAKKDIPSSSSEIMQAPTRNIMLTRTIDFGHGNTHTFNMVKDLDIQLEDISGEMQKQAGDYGFLAVAHEVSVKNAEALKVVAEETHASRYFELKTGDFAKQYPGVKMTEEGIKHALTLDTEVQDAHKKYQEALHESKILFRYTLATIQKKDMLQSLNSSMNKDK